ncbi:PilZ domain-containing protein [uncultured Desulfosarcina sp.]|uniref:PilZ domain-containing protein n=1 Tax=uncultured Desulfosarcina sp. TaxID=218289 RepID=UPI0029C6C5AC|nr:PilZ domain-containing protein [uncultured Desulfosarcina sp.]
MDQSSDRKQRRFPRRAAYIIARYTVKEGIFRDIIKNIGATGIFVSTSRGISPEQPIELEFPVFEFENLIRVKGTVSRSSQKGFSVIFDQPIQGLICKEGHFPEIVHESNR